MLKKICIGFLWCILFHTPLWAQNKYEREYRLKKEEVPGPAKDFLSECNFDSKIKWYGEESLEGHSVEAKLKENKLEYSIEFDTLGNLQDIEIDVDWEELEAVTQQNILNHLDQHFEKHRFIKIQMQWTGEEDVLLELIQKGKTNQSYTTKYEIVLKGKAEKKSAWYEFLFSDVGMFEKKARIIFRNTDNLDY